MSGLTLTQCETALAEAIALHTKLKNGEEVRQGDRTLKYSDLKEVREDIAFWDARCKELSSGDGSGNITPKSIVPVDL